MSAVAVAPAPVRDDRLRLPDGRVLAVAEWGEPGGVPVVLLHGMPGSRRFCPDPVATTAAGVRLVTFDRPGYGGSSSTPQRTMVDLAPDVDALLDDRGLGAVGLVGWSGGGPFAVAYAQVRPERVAGLAIVSAPGPLDEVPGAWEALGARRRPTAETARREPHRSRRAIGHHMEPFLADPESFLGTGRGPDAAVLADAAAGGMLRAQVREALQAGVDGLAGDLVASWLDWGFRLRELGVPTAVFHGAQDPHNHADVRTYAREVPGATLTVWPDAGHLGIVPHWREVLDAVTGRR